MSALKKSKFVCFQQPFLVILVSLDMNFLSFHYWYHAVCLRLQLFYPNAYDQYFLQHKVAITNVLLWVWIWTRVGANSNFEANTNTSIHFLKMKQIRIWIKFGFQKTIWIYLNSSNYSNMNTNSANVLDYLTTSG